VSRATVSVILITRDEAANLGATLDSVRWAGEIVVVDSGSTDGTEAIAREHGARFVVKPWAGYGPQKQHALTLATGEWVLSIDADERVTPELRRAIETAVADPGGRVGFLIERHTYYLGQWFGRHGWWRERVLRLFRRDRASFTGAAVHEHAEVEGPVGVLRGALEHYPYHGSISRHVDQINGYTTLMAVERNRRGASSGAVRPLLHAAGRFLSNYVRRGWFLNGRAGLVAAVLGAFYTFLKYAKLWELGRVAREPAGVVKHGRAAAEGIGPE
jgi:glycosyltransferase involved in cell wall biosynthesis